jgi:hypothetical protein
MIHILKNLNLFPLFFEEKTSKNEGGNLFWTLLIFCNFFAKIAHNVPAVCDVLPARIEKCVAFLGLAKCAGVSRANERSD